MRIRGEHKVKVQGEFRTPIDRLKNDQQLKRQANRHFSSMVAKQGEKMHSEQITRLLGHISAAGDRLARSRNLRDMAKFKMLVRHFMQESVDMGLRLNTSHTWNRYGEGRQLKHVKVIDEKLIELSESLLADEKEAVDLLEKIGEIKGLLINLYT